jgi:hypothetical protein
MTLRKIASLLVAFGLVLGLFGAGISAQFTDQATAGMTIQVGTFDISVTSAQGTVSCPAGLNVCTVSYTASTIQSSAAGTSPFVFTVTSNGSIPALIHVTATSPATPFADVLVPVADFTLNNGGSHVFNAGLSWPELINGNLGMSTSITYTILATG